MTPLPPSSDVKERAQSAWTNYEPPAEVTAAIAAPPIPGLMRHAFLAGFAASERALQPGHEAMLREALVALCMAAGKLNVALDGQERYRRHRQAVLDAMEKARAALSQPTNGAVERDWQPIESAPRDAEDILVLHHNRSVQLVVAWSEHEQRWATLDGPSYHAEAFTHWRPLADPPRAILTPPKSPSEEMA